MHKPASCPCTSREARVKRSSRCRHEVGVQQSLVNPDRDTLYYDGQCGLCQRSTRFIRSLDWLGRLRFVDMTSVAPESLPVAWEVAMQGIPMRTRDGRTHVGYPAVRRALLQTPLGALPALAMYLPGVSHVGRRVYRHIAENRGRAACSVNLDQRAQ